MNEEQIKQYLMDNLRVYAEIDEEVTSRLPNMKRLVVTLSLGREVISQSKLWI